MSKISIFNFTVNKEVADVAMSPFFCVSHAKQYDEANVGLYTTLQLQFADALLDLVKKAYPRSRVYLNYRKTFIAVKVENPRLADKASVDAFKLDTVVEDFDIEIVRTKFGHLIFRADHKLLNGLKVDFSATM